MKKISKIIILLMLLSITAFHPARVNAAQQQRLSAGIISISIEYQNKPVVVPNEITTVSSPDTEEIEEPNPAPAPARINLSEEEYWLLCRCVEAEGGITSKLTRIAIAEVIINRVLSPKHPNNVYDVIYFPNAFEVVENGRIDQVTPTEETIDAVNTALYQQNYDNITAFRSDYYHSFGEDAFERDNMFFSKE